LHTLQQTEDVYKLFGLLSSQVFQLATVFVAEKSDNPAKDFGIHPYVISKLTPIANKLGKRGISNLVEIFAKTDDQIKSSGADPWLLIERCLLRLT
jgi:DNA polymerase III delta subunit